jgi:Rieske Fe-S protein
VTEHDEGHGPAEPEGDGGHHLPRPTAWPLLFAAGVALLLVGVALNWVIFGIGAGIAILAGAIWAWDQGREHPEVEELEEEQESRQAALEKALEEGEEPERFPRNVFLERTTLGLGAVIGVAVTVPVVGFAVAPTFIDQVDPQVDLGPYTNFPEGTYLITTFRGNSVEGQVSERTAFVRNNGLKDDAPSFTIISNRCVHLGCPVQPAGPTGEPQAYTAAEQPVRVTETAPANFVCPCHGGAYDLEGNVISGPPVRALDRYSYSIVDGNLVLGERFSVTEVDGEGADAVMQTTTRFDPGQHVDGPEAWLYPASPQGI